MLTFNKSKKLFHMYHPFALHVVIALKILLGTFVKGESYVKDGVGMGSSRIKSEG